MAGHRPVHLRHLVDRPRLRDWPYCQVLADHLADLPGASDLVDRLEAVHLVCLHPVVLPWVLDLLVHPGRSVLSVYLEVDPAGRSVGSVVALLESVAMCPLVDFMGRHRNGLVVLADHLDDPASEAQC
jgi:hypothetical protein